MNYIDIVILGCVGIGMLIGLYKGLVREVAGLAGLLAGIVGARIVAPQLMPWLEQHAGVSAQWSYMAAWTVCFVGVALAVNAVGWLLTRTLEAVSLGCVNKLLGGIFGGIKYILLFSILFNLIGMASDYVSLPGAEARDKSVLYGPVKGAAGWLINRISQPEKGENSTI